MCGQNKNYSGVLTINGLADPISQSHISFPLLVIWPFHWSFCLSPFSPQWTAQPANHTLSPLLMLADIQQLQFSKPIKGDSRPYSQFISFLQPTWLMPKTKMSTWWSSSVWLFNSFTYSIVQVHYLRAFHRPPSTWLPICGIAPTLECLEIRFTGQFRGTRNTSRGFICSTHVRWLVEYKLQSTAAAAERPGPPKAISFWS